MTWPNIHNTYMGEEFIDSVRRLMGQRTAVTFLPQLEALGHFDLEKNGNNFITFRSFLLDRRSVFCKLPPTVL